MWTLVRQTTNVVTAVSRYSGQSRAGWLWLRVKSHEVAKSKAMTMGAMPDLNARMPSISRCWCAQRVAV